MRKLHPTQTRLRELFDYHGNGYFVRRMRTGRSTHIGQEVRGCRCADGYLQVGVDGKPYFLHNLIWIWHNGDLPSWPLTVDHYPDRTRDNCCIGNLRVATKREQQLNSATSLDRGLPVGICENRGGFLAQTPRVNGKQSKKWFRTASEAEAWLAGFRAAMMALVTA